jgi:hypothetical protein
MVREAYTSTRDARLLFGHNPVMSSPPRVGGSGCVSKPGGGGLSLGFSSGDARVVSPGHGSHAATY